MQSLAEKKASLLEGRVVVPKWIGERPDASPSREMSVVTALVQSLAELGVEQAFGVSGGAIALLFDALEESSIELRHFRHETGAAFAATEAYFVEDKPAVVFATTGPGALNALTGLTAARWDGAKVILITGATNPAQRGRWATQETSSYTFPQDAFYTQGATFHFAVRMERASELPEVVARLAAGISRPGGFVAHVCLPMTMQSERLVHSPARRLSYLAAPAPPAEEVAEIARLLRRERFAIWLGFGARRALRQVRELLRRSGAPVICSPRAKGIVPEDHPQFVGVSGLGGHQSVLDYMHQHPPTRTLVLGSRLGEPTSFWDRDLIPPEGFIHVDIDPEVPGTAYPDCQTIGVTSEISSFLDALLPHFPSVVASDRSTRRAQVSLEPVPPRLAGRAPVRPRVLMDVVQRLVVDATDALVLAECGNAFAWCNHYLQFREPGRYRVSTLFGSMGHTAAGVVGAALARQGKAVAVVGDGSMLMQSEVSSAVQYQADAVWIVLNDAGYGMCRDGHNALGLTGEGVDFPEVDFAELAISLGADGARIETEDQIETVLRCALRAVGPFVVDVRIDPTQSSPLLSRFESLIKQGNSKNVAGWEA